MRLSLNINGRQNDINASAGDTLLKVLRTQGYFSVKHGCETGECGACAVLIDGRPVNSCVYLAAQAEGHNVETIEPIGEHPEKGWIQSSGLHPLQTSFVKSGAIQCGYCTPAMILAAKHLIDKNPSPTDEEIREALSGILCRCTGYLKPVQAVQQAAGFIIDNVDNQEDTSGVFDSKKGKVNEGSDYDVFDSPFDFFKPSESGTSSLTQVRPKVIAIPETDSWQRVGKPEDKVDAIKLVQGKPAFAADIDSSGILHAKVLHSPVAHALIKRIDVSRALELPGVAAVLTWEDLPRVIYSTAGQSDPIPGPLDTFSLDKKVRFVGDRVAFVAAESPEIAMQALDLIEVEYEELQPILDSADALKEGAPILHDEPEYVNFAESDPSRNLAAQIRIDIGDVENGFSQADFIFEKEYIVPKVQQGHIEPHIAVTYWDEDDRLVIRTSTQVPFHVRRQLAPVLGLPIKRIRVIKPRIGGGFGGKQEVLIEDVAAHLTIATGRPVIYEYSREEEFIAARSRHPMRIRMKTGVKKDGTLTANAMYALSDTGAYGCHAVTVTGNTGHKAMALYVGDGIYRQSPNIRFYADVVYTNHPP
ncbi:MAG: molybdopterin cofactor-binding domain-containing protein, partial [Anaerolineales bacterium]